MTVSTTDSRFPYSGNGSTTAFSFPREYRAAADLVVRVRNTTTGVETTKTLTTHYTVTGVSDAHGGFSSATITFVTAPTSSETVTIYRDPALTQETNPESQADPRYALHNALDLIEYKFQRVDDRLDRAVRRSEGSTATFDPTLPDSVLATAGYGLVLNSAKDGLNYAALASAPVSAALAAVVNESTIARAMARLGGPNWINVKNPLYGALGDGATDDTAAIEAAAAAAGIGGVVYFPSPGTYIADDLDVSLASQTWIVERGAKLKMKANTTNRAIIDVAAADFTFIGKIDGNRANGNADAGYINVASTAPRCSIDVIASECGYFPVFATDAPNLKVRGKFSACDRAAIFTRLVSATADVEGCDIDVDIDFSDRAAGAFYGGILVRGIENNGYKFNNCRVNARVLLPVAATLSSMVAVEVKAARNVEANVKSYGGSMCFSVSEVYGASGVLNGQGFSFYGLEYVSSEDCDFSGNLNGKDRSGTIQTLQCLAYNSDIYGAIKRCNWRGTLANAKGGANSRLINYADNAVDCRIDGTFSCGDANYVIYCQEAGSVDISGEFYGDAGGDYIAVLNESTGRVSVRGIARQFDNAGMSIISTTAITIDHVRLDVVYQDCNGGGIATTLSGGAALGEHVSDMSTGLQASSSTVRARVLNQKRNVIFAETTGSPESVVTAGIGSLCLRADGSDGSTLYHKASGTGNTGWVAQPVLASGVYTPTLTGATNVAASTAFQCQYGRVGSVVTVSGRLDVDPTAGAYTELGISLPIASNIGAGQDCTGTAASPNVASLCAAIFGDSANDRATLAWTAVDTANRDWYFSFTYRVI